MHPSTILLAALSATSLGVFAQEIQQEDIPSQCRDICLDAVAIGVTCDQDDDSDELNCICTARGADTEIPNCEACVAQYDERDNDVYDIVSSCSFTRASTFTTPMMTIQTAGTATATSTTTSTSSGSSSSSTTITSTGPAASSTVLTLTDSSRLPTATVTGPAPTGTTADGGNAAPGYLAPGLGVAIGAVLAALGIM